VVDSFGCFGFDGVVVGSGGGILEVVDDLVVVVLGLVIDFFV
jgi:hypothetical protein